MNKLQDNVEDAIDEIIESNSNENGNWIKYGSGIALCWKNYSGTTNISIQIGGGYRSSSIGGSTLPIELTQLTGAWVNGQCDFVDENKWAWTLMNAKATTTKFPSLNFISNYSSTSRNYTASLFVIGRWK